MITKLLFQKTTKLVVFSFLLIGFYPLKAQIVYTDIAPDCTTTMSPTVGSGTNLCPIDMNNDGTAEYGVRWDDYTSMGMGWFMHLTYNGNANNKIALKGTTVNPYGGRFIQPITQNTSIDATLLWGTSSPEPFIGESTTDTNFLDLGERYIGVQFVSGVNTYYGWILVDFVSSPNRMLTVKSYAYNSVPNAPILAGQASVLSTKEVGTDSISIAPNPAQDVLNIFGINETIEYQIISMTGQVLQKGSTTNAKVNISNLPDATYLINLKTNKNKTPISIKFIKSSNKK